MAASRMGPLYLAVVLDAWSRKVVGWAMGTHLRTELVLEALEMAIEQRRPCGVAHHSDQGSQYTSLAFGKRCREAGIRPSTGSVGDCYDNALCESFFAILECERLAARRYRTPDEARLDLFPHPNPPVSAKALTCPPNRGKARLAATVTKNI